MTKEELLANYLASQFITVKRQKDGTPVFKDINSRSIAPAKILEMVNVIIRGTGSLDLVDPQFLASYLISHAPSAGITPEYVADISTGQIRKPFIDENIYDLVPFSTNSDSKFFHRFKFVFNDMDNSYLILVSDLSGGYRCIYTSDNIDRTVKELKTVCSELPADPPKPGFPAFMNLHDQLVSSLKSVMKGMAKKYSTGAIKTPADLVAALSKSIPISMLSTLDLFSICREKTRTVVGPDGNPHTTTCYDPSTLYFKDGSRDTDVMDFLVRHIDMLATRPEFKIAMPKIFSNRHDEPAIVHIDLDSLCAEGPAPTWEHYMKRYPRDEADVLMAYIWSIFDADNNGRQMLYIHDPQGYSGKSTMIDCIVSALGPDLCMPVQKESLNNQFAVAKVWNKRLVTVGDNKNPNLLRAQLMHMMLGHDWADCEMKGKNSFAAKLMNKVIASGNIALNIDPNADHEVTRLIVVSPHMDDDDLKECCALNEDGTVRRRPNGKPVFIGDATFGERLKAEFKFFLTKCRESYSRLCPHRSDIIISDSMYEKVLSFAAMEFSIAEEFFNQFYRYDKNAPGMSVAEFSRSFHENLAIFNPEGDRTLTLESVKEYIEKTYSEVSFGKPKKVGGRTQRIITGIVAKAVPKIKASKDSLASIMEPASPGSGIGSEWADVV